MTDRIFQRILKARWLQHLLFWGVSWYLLLRMFASSGRILPVDLIYTTLFMITVIAGVYVNLLLLIPLFLAKKKYFPYALLLTFSVALFAWLNMLLFSRFIDYILPGYYFISYYDYPDLLKFFIAFTLISTLLKLSKGWFQLMETRSNLARLEKENATAELASLKGQINPHFLFNSLNTIYSLVMKKSDLSAGYILKLSGFLRYVLYETSSGCVSLDTELSNMQDYIELQKLRAGKHASVSYQVSGNPAGKKIAPLLFLPLIENSFKHGIKGETGPSFVDISILIGETRIEFDIRNNPGYADPVGNRDRPGIGLENLRRRLDLLFPGRYEMMQTEDENSYRVKLVVPLQYEAPVPDR